MFVHLVYFWLKDGTPATAREEMVKEAETSLAKIPAVRHVWAGRPAMTPRPVVDNTYDVGLCVAYDDQAGHDAYQTHELHVAFGSRFKQYWQRVQVYDFK